MHRRFKWFALLLVLGLLGVVWQRDNKETMNQALSAQEASDQRTSDQADIYTYYWERDSDNPGNSYWSKTPHYVSVSDTNITPYIFRLQDLENPSEFFPAYCSDMDTVIESQTTYRRINLEDSTYFDDTTAGYIRGILKKGYWPSMSMSDVENTEIIANAWLEAYGSPESYRIHNLTAAQAITATQAAIWYRSNKAENMIPYSGTHDVGWTEQLHDSNVDTKEYVDEYTKTNVELFYEYLIHQQYEAPEKLIFANEHFVESSAVLSENTLSYKVTLLFKLTAPAANADQLTVTGVLGNQTKSATLGTDIGLQPDEKGYYHMSFEGVTPETAANGILLTMSGHQMVDDVYFYEAKPAEGTTPQKTSENLVGFSKGLTPVKAETTIPVKLGDAKVSLVKYDDSVLVEENTSGAVQVNGSWHPVMEGVKFQLYAVVHGSNVLLKNNLITDSNGSVTADGLSPDYEYFFLEAKAPEGYLLNTKNHFAAVWTDKEDSVYIANIRENGSEEEPETNVPEEEPGQGDTEEGGTDGNHTGGNSPGTGMEENITGGGNFTAEDMPGTGDPAMIGIWIVLLVIAGAMVGYIIYRKKKDL